MLSWTSYPPFFRILAQEGHVGTHAASGAVPSFEAFVLGHGFQSRQFWGVWNISSKESKYGGMGQENQVEALGTGWPGEAPAVRIGPRTQLLGGSLGAVGWDRGLHSWPGRQEFEAPCSTWGCAPHGLGMELGLSSQNFAL
ncbi:MAG: hypothetical protein SRB2_02146 [Desulfobacteraceae bacterium Eth-SRB2]|nr:MAG: hypothetical protein SRB2_02146 [Desulfobacteraceae bacterium Eth-SRB2]